MKTRYWLAGLMLASCSAWSFEPAGQGGAYGSDSANAYSTEAQAAFENVLGRPLDSNAAAAIDSRIAEAERSLEVEPQVRLVSSDGHVRTLLACVHANGGLGFGVIDVVCYDWRKARTYLMDGLEFFDGGLTGGVDIVVADHHEGSSLEGAYACGDLGVGALWFGFRTLHCERGAPHELTAIDLTGFQVGVGLQFGENRITIRKT